MMIFIDTVYYIVTREIFKCHKVFIIFGSGVQAGLIPRPVLLGSMSTIKHEPS
jgi:hypothetical protein